MQEEQFRLFARLEDKDWWFVARRNILLDLLSAHLPASMDKTVLEIGMGTGGNLRALAERYRCVGIDTSALAVKLCKQRVPSALVLHGNAATDFPEEIRHADAILLLDVLEHVMQDGQLLSDVVGHMRVGAQLLIAVPAERRLWGPHDLALGHYRRYDLARLRESWKGLPVTEQVLSYFNARLYPLARLVRWITRRTGRPCGHAGTRFRMLPAPINWLLRRVFNGESKRLLDLLEGKRETGYSRGVSLVALLRRDPDATPRGREGHSLDGRHSQGILVRESRNGPASA